MHNTNGRKTAGIAIPATRIAPYLVYPVADSVFMNDVFGAVVGDHFIFAAVDTTKRKDAPLGLSRIHRKTSYGAGTGRF